jgi:hypothetical protein
MVTEVSSSSDEGYVLMIQNSTQFSVRISNLNLPTPRPGDYVTAGQVVATSAPSVAGAATGSVKIIVYLNGGIVCPYSFFDVASRGRINQFLISNTFPCGT